MSTHSQEKEVLLILCDISGYTQFMTANRHALAHSYVIISQLMKTVLQHAKRPLQVAKLEGDAVFLYALQQGSASERAQRMWQVMEMLLRLSRAFETRRRELEQANICPCEACKNVDRLRLKIIVHSGTALFHRIDRFDELSGVDVILAHRLLKNSLRQSQYILLTETAQRDLGSYPMADCVESQEHCEGLGTIKTFLYRPLLGTEQGLPSDRPRSYTSLRFRAKDILTKILLARLAQLRLVRWPRFNNLPNWQPARFNTERCV